VPYTLFQYESLDYDKRAVEWISCADECLEHVLYNIFAYEDVSDRSNAVEPNVDFDVLYNVLSFEYVSDTWSLIGQEGMEIIEQLDFS